MSNQESCSICQKTIVMSETSIGTGYGINQAGEKVCYSCCAEQDKQFMREHGKIVLYLDKTTQLRGHDKVISFEVINWPGSLKFKASGKSGRHNLARSRTDVWFKFEGQNWHGVQYGKNSYLCYCKQLKS
jgi:hypothetical protein